MGFGAHGRHPKGDRLLGSGNGNGWVGSIECWCQRIVKWNEKNREGKRGNEEELQRGDKKRIRRKMESVTSFGPGILYSGPEKVSEKCSFAHSISRCSSVQFTPLHFRSVRFGSVQFSLVRLSSVRFSSGRFSSVRFISGRFSSVRFSSGRFSSVRFSSV